METKSPRKSKSSDDGDPYSRCLSRALQLLTARDRTVAELRKRLVDGDHDPEIVERVMARLEELGYLDDRRVARTWADAAQRSGRWFGMRLRNELLRRGVPRDIADDVSRQQDDDSIDAAARQLLARRSPGYAPETATTSERQRLYRFLISRGIPPAAAMTALKTKADDETP